jgi:hypothetical protein
MTGRQLISQRRERVDSPLGARVVWHYLVTGDYITSKGDNASFLHDATEDYRGKPVRKLTRARWRRVVRRNLAVTVPVLLAAGSITPWVTLWMLYAYVGLCVVLAAGWSTYRLVSAWRGRRLNREWVDPTAAVLCKVLNLPYNRKRARQMIDLPAGWGAGADDDTNDRLTARVAIPAGTALSAGVKAQITQNVGARLGIPAPVQADWREAGAAVSVELSAAPMPPAVVTYADLLPAIARAAEDEVVIGRKAQGHFVTLSLSEDAPHFLMSGAAGSGKSVLLRVILRQRLERGDGVMIMDPKRFSHIRWAGELGRDRVVYAYTDVDLHEAWLAVGAEIHRRIKLPTEDLAGQRRVFVVAEEINAQIKILNRYWRGKRAEIMRRANAILGDAVRACEGSRVAGLEMALEDGLDMADLNPPAISPAVTALQESVFMGRELRMHVLAAAQRASANVFGGNGGDVRESFQGGRLIAKWDRRLWKMLVDTIAYVACPNGKRGIWGLARGGVFEIFRVPLMPEEDMVTAIRGAAPSTGPVLGPQTGVRTIESMDTPAIMSAVTLAMALDSLPGQDGPAALSLEGLRTASKRPGFPVPLDKPDGTPYGRSEARLWGMADLVSWAEGRLAINQ